MATTTTTPSIDLTAIQTVEKGNMLRNIDSQIKRFRREVNGFLAKANENFEYAASWLFVSALDAEMAIKRLSDLRENIECWTPEHNDSLEERLEGLYGMAMDHLRSKPWDNHSSSRGSNMVGLATANAIEEELKLIEILQKHLRWRIEEAKEAAEKAAEKAANEAAAAKYPGIIETGGKVYAKDYAPTKHVEDLFDGELLTDFGDVRVYKRSPKGAQTYYEVLCRTEESSPDWTIRATVAPGRSWRKVVVELETVARHIATDMGILG